MPFDLLMCFCQMHFKCNVSDIILMCVMFVLILYKYSNHICEVIEVEVIAVLCHRKSGHIAYTNILDYTDRYMSF